jgi:hypothetical protein
MLGEKPQKRIHVTRADLGYGANFYVWEDFVSKHDGFEFRFEKGDIVTCRGRDAVFPYPMDRPDDLVRATIMEDNLVHLSKTPPPED